VTLPAVSVPRRLPLTRRRALTPAARIESARVCRVGCPAATAGVARIALFQQWRARWQRSKEVFRRILDSTVSLEQGEIAWHVRCALALIWRRRSPSSWPCARPLESLLPSPAPADVIGSCDWIENGFFGRPLPPSLQVRCLGVEDDAGLQQDRPARLLARAEAGWGRATSGLALARYATLQPARLIPTRLTMIAFDAKAKADQTGRVATGSGAGVICAGAGDGGRRAAPDRGQRRARIPPAHGCAQERAGPSGGGCAAGPRWRAAHSAHFAADLTQIAALIGTVVLQRSRRPMVQRVPARSRVLEGIRARR